MSGPLSFRRMKNSGVMGHIGRSTMAEEAAGRLARKSTEELAWSTGIIILINAVGPSSLRLDPNSNSQ